jgi:hypothetical protein
VDGEVQVCVDEEKIAQEALWDGLHGVLTNIRNKEMKPEEVLSHYHGLWQAVIEQFDRLTDHLSKYRRIIPNRKTRFESTPGISLDSRSYQSAHRHMFCCLRTDTFRTIFRQVVSEPVELLNNHIKSDRKHQNTSRRKGSERNCTEYRKAY